MQPIKLPVCDAARGQIVPAVPGELQEGAVDTISPVIRLVGLPKGTMKDAFCLNGILHPAWDDLAGLCSEPFNQFIVD